MKAVVIEKYNDYDAIQIKEVEKPTPKPNDVIIKVKAAGVAAGDWRMRTANPVLARLVNGLFRPKRIPVLGFELAGIIDEIGSEVSNYKVGDEVFGAPGILFGAHAEFCRVCLNKKNHVLAMKPKNISFEEAAGVPVGGTTAISFLTQGEVKEGDEVLIYGASGSVGSYAVQIAKIWGAKVTAVCSSKNHGWVKDFGADEVVDYQAEDFKKRLKKYDFILDAVWKISKKELKPFLKPGGKFLSVSMDSSISHEDMDQLRQWIEDEKVRVKIDQVFPMKQAPEAHRLVASGHKKGNVILKISD